MRWRMIFFSSASNASCAFWRYSAYSGASTGPEYCVSTASSTAFVAFWRSSLSWTDVASSSAAPCDWAISSTRPSGAFLISISCFGLPASACSSRWAAHSCLIAECAMSSASRISASGTSLAPHSTIRTASSVPATTRSMSAVRSCSSVGLTTKLPSTLPMRTAPTGVGYGMSEIISAADAPFIARMSYVWTWSTESVRLTSCVSRRQPFGKSGRSGRSIMRAISVAFSPARPSRLKNEPGILPAAYMRSSTSTVSGRKSTSRRLPAVAVESTTVSPAVTVTAPEACLAILPVSKAISVPPISTAIRCTSDICPFLVPASVSAGALCIFWTLRYSLTGMLVGAFTVGAAG